MVLHRKDAMWLFILRKGFQLMRSDAPELRVALCRPADTDSGCLQAAGRRAALAVLLAAVSPAVVAWPSAALDPTASAAAPAPTDASFNSAFLAGRAKVLDLGRYAHGNPVDPGSYSVDIHVNGDWIGRRSIRFVAVPASMTAWPCFTSGQLDELGIKPAAVAGMKASADSRCRLLPEWVDQANARYDSSEMRLDLSVPQVALQRQARGYVEPQYWSHGIVAGFLNYSVNVYQYRMEGRSMDFHPDPQVPPGALDPVTGRPLEDGRRYRRPTGIEQTSAYAGLDGGFNLGAWQFRHTSAFNWQSGYGGRWQNIASYAQYYWPSARTQLLLGDAYTNGELFDAIAYRGVQARTDDRMFPDSLRGYAPIVRGVATSNARVEVRQNGYVIYQITVAPGPFEIRDLYPTGYGGDLQVRITEADGSQRQFSVPYASVAQSLRPGISRYSAMMGKVREQSLHFRPMMMQGTFQRGISNSLTGYAGALASSGYVSALAGAAVMTRAGAFSLDVTGASLRLPGYGSRNGQSVKFGFSKFVQPTGTQFALAAYRYSTSGFMGLRDYLYARDQIAADPVGRYAIQRQRSRFELTLNQSLGSGGGSIYATGSTLDYWGDGHRASQYQLGYNNVWRRLRLNYNLSASRLRDLAGRSETQYFLTLSLPLGYGSHAPQLNSAITRSDRGHTQEQLGVTGSLGIDNNLNYGLTMQHDSRDGGGTEGSANVQYRSPYSQLSGSYGQGGSYRQASLGAVGSVVVHGGGLSFSPQTGDTMAIVHAAGARGARVSNYSGLRIDRWGHAVIPYLIPYRQNTVQIDPQGLSTDIELDDTSQQVAPYAGAIVKLDFHTRQGRAVLIDSRAPDGSPLPFAAPVFDAAGHQVGLVGQASQLYVRSMPDQGRLQVQWGEQPSERCEIHYQLPPRKAAGAAYYQTIRQACTAMAAAVDLPAGRK